MTRHGRPTQIGEPSGYGKFDDNDHDFTHELDARPCTLCGLHPMKLPHSVCKVCLERKRHARHGKDTV